MALERKASASLSIKRTKPLDFYECFRLYDQHQKKFVFDSKKVSDLEKTGSEESKHFLVLVNELKEIAQEKDRIVVNRRLVTFLKKLFIDAFVDHNVPLGTIKMEVCVAGSLAKSLATPYSDIDCFIVLDDTVSKNDKEKIQLIADKLYLLSQALFLRSNQFLMDSFGITVANLCGTVKEVFDKIRVREDGGDDVSALTVSVCNATSVYGNNALLTKLQATLDQDLTPQFYFDKAIKEYAGPHDIKGEINLKECIFRPIDFMLQGFRKACGISLQEFSEPKRLLEELVKRNVISDAVSNLVRYIQEKAYEIRYKEHESKKREHDKVPSSEEVRELIGLVGWLRGSLVNFLEHREELEVFDLHVQKYLSSGDAPNMVATRMQKVNQLKNRIYGELRKPLSQGEEDKESKLAPHFEWRILNATVEEGIYESKLNAEFKEVKERFNPAWDTGSKIGGLFLTASRDKLTPTLKKMLEAVLNEKLFPALLDEEGKIHLTIWQRLNFHRNIGRHEDVNLTDHHKISKILVCELLATLLPEYKGTPGQFNVLDAALSFLMTNRDFLDRTFLSYLFSPLKKPLHERINCQQFDAKLEPLFSANFSKKFVELDLEGLNKIQKFLVEDKTAENVVIFLNAKR